MRVVDTSGTPAPFMDAFPSSPVFARYLPQYTDTTLVRLSYPIVDIPMVLIVLFHYCVKGTFSFVLFWLCTFSLPLACPPSKTRACAISDTSPSHPICMKTPASARHMVPLPRPIIFVFVHASLCTPPLPCATRSSRWFPFVPFTSWCSLCSFLLGRPFFFCVCPLGRMDLFVSMSDPGP